MIIFFFNDTATTEIYTLSLHDALPILNADVLQMIRRTDARQHEQMRRANRASAQNDLPEIGRAHV